MWDRLRSATGAGGGGGGATAASAPSSAGGPADPFSSRMLAPSGAKGRASTFSPSSSTPSNQSWQPRSAAVDAQQQQHQQQRLAPPHYGSNNLAGKVAGPPPPRQGRGYESAYAPPADRPYQPHSQQQRSQTLPVRPPPHHQNQQARHDSYGRPTSSIYSQPSPLYTDFARNQPMARYPYTADAGEVSPPSSPEACATPLAPYQDISPIDEEDDWPATRETRQQAPPLSTNNAPADHSMLPSQRRVASRDDNMPSEQAEKVNAETGRPQSPTTSTTRSNIPMMRRERRKKEAQAAAGRLRTTSGHGEAQPNSPSSPSSDPVQGLGISTVTAAESPTSPTRFPPRNESRTSRTPTGPRVGGPRPQPQHPQQPQQQPVSQTDPAATAYTASRPGWKGASGRTAIVDPVRDNLEAEPLKIPPKSARRTSPRTTESGQQQQKQQQQFGMQNGGATIGAAIEPGNGGGEAVINNVTMVSPPLSPETQRPEQQALGQIGGGGGAGELTAATAPKSSFANTFRKIIPSSGQRQSRIFSGSAIISSLGGQQTQQQQKTSAAPGYPSPPLSGTTPLETTHQQPVADANAGTVHVPHGQPSLTNSSPFTHPIQNNNHNLLSNRQPSLRRKQVGSSSSSNNHNNNRAANHRPHESFSSSVYSAPDETPNNKSHLESDSAAPASAQLLAPSPPLHQQQTVASPSYKLDTKNLPSLPGEATGDSPYIQPPSRFSITTYATSARTSSPRDSIDTSAPPLPTPPKDFVMDLAHSNSVRSAQGGSGRAASATQSPLTESAAAAAAAGTGPQPGDSVMDRKRPELRAGVNRWEDPESDDIEPLKISLSKAWMSTAGANSAGINAMNSPPRSRKPTPRALNFLFDRGNSKSNSKSKNNNNAAVTAAAAAATDIPAPPLPKSSGGNIARPAPLTATSSYSREYTPSNLDTPESSNNNSKTLGFGFLSQLSPAIATAPTSRPASIISNVDKDLPPAPSVTAASAAAAIASTTSSSSSAVTQGGGTTSDRIAQLTSQLEDLANRRMNINRAIKQMTEMMPKDNLIMPDEVRKKREVEKRKIEELRGKLSDIQGEEHDLGMKLHRAYKKLDKQTEYEPTTLWVRRATGA
ncbi:hypothetical protein BD289DRAFT_479351 [Coniella lustricola]|uniref:Uncharacterized protein n=1 Tax=Coniella lustricola TaxID=2025994 RepID=A0A2T3AJD0_9PEZI|nr:hypothetical protein BD289DRAFT_479351 [Coniella lustricola]